MLNPNSPIPLYRQLADLLTARIRAGEYPVGSRIPSEHQLADAYRLGRPTIRQAVDQLVRKGLLARRRGSGTYVCEAQKEVDLFSLDGTSASFRKKGLASKTRMVAPIELRVVDDSADNPFAGRRAYTLSRLTSVGNVPVLMEVLYLDADLFKDIDRLDLAGRSLSALAEDHFYLKPVGGRQTFRIDYVNGDIAGRLKVDDNTPVLLVNRWLHFPHTENGVYARLWCRTDQFVFSQTIGGTGYA